MAKRRCAYCGLLKEYTKDHVISRALYPEDKPQKGVAQLQKLTVPSCRSCNNGWSNDEAHVRDVLLLAGEPNATVRELWEKKTRGSFKETDGRKRLQDLFAGLKEQPDGTYKIYPANDERVLRVIRKIVRGLCYRHMLRWPISDEEVWVDIQRYAIQPEFLDLREFSSDPTVIRYAFMAMDDPDIESYWTLTFFERTPFIAIVFRSPETQNLLQSRIAGNTLDV